MPKYCETPAKPRLTGYPTLGSACGKEISFR